MALTHIRNNMGIDQKTWFNRFQGVLVALANTDFGRDLLCIDKGFPRITKIAPNFIQAYHGGGRFTTEFRTAAKYANVIRYRWNAIIPTLQWLAEFERGIQFQKTPIIARGLRGTTTTVYPDSTETTTCDGRVNRDIVSETWTGIRDNTEGTAAAIDDTETWFWFLETSANPNEWRALFRGFFLFDTSAISASDDIDDGTISFYGTVKQDTGLSATEAQMKLHAVSSSPASNTTLAAADYDQVGTTSFGSVTYASFSTTGYNDITLNASGLSNIIKEGISKFATRNGADLDNSEPTYITSKNAGVQGYYAEQTGTTNDPKLVVNHSAAVGTEQPFSPSGAAIGGFAIY